MSGTDNCRAEIPDSPLRVAAHDLRQHFHVFEVGLQLLDRPQVTDAQRSETIQLLKQESKQAKATLDALLELAGLSAPRQ
ncbi:MAG TPA: hypothetical protein VMM76_02055 [Pirellulaceae bacterium]|nr:hypothetical protein [Pirellulaceae bacterium]